MKYSPRKKVELEHEIQRITSFHMGSNCVVYLVIEYNMKVLPQSIMGLSS